MNFPRLFLAELQRELTLLIRYPFELFSRLIWNLGFALMIFFGFGAIGAQSGSLPGFQEGQTGRLLGMLITYIAINGLNNANELLAQESQTGTLEQAALSPPPLLVVMLMRDLASYAEMLVRFAVVLAIALLITGVRLHLDVPVLVLLLTLMYLGTEGLGLALGGATLLYKRVATLSQFVVMLVFGLAILPLETLPGWMSGLIHHFPFTQALIMLRLSAIHGVPLSQMALDGSLFSLVVTSLGFLVAGSVAFGVAERQARAWGTLNQY